MTTNPNHNIFITTNSENIYRIGVLYQGPAVQTSAQYDAFSEIKNFKFHFLYMNEKQRNPAWKPSYPEYSDYSFLPPPSKFWPKNIKYHLNANIFPVLDKNDFDGMILHSIYDSSAAWQSINWCKRKKRPYLLRCDANVTKEKSRYRRIIRKTFISKIIEGSSAILYIGTQNKRFYELYGARQGQFFLAPWEIDYHDLEKFYQQAVDDRVGIRNKLRIKPDEIVIITIGRLLKWKGFDLVINAVAKLYNDGSKVKLVVVGDGPYKNTLEKRINASNCPAVLVGNKDRKGVVECLTISDIFVLASTFEPWGLVVNEAALCGLPLVLSDAVGASADLLNNNINGYTFRSGNLDSLVKALQMLALNQTLRSKMGDISNEIIRKWRDENSAIAGYQNALNTVFGIKE